MCGMRLVSQCSGTNTVTPLGREKIASARGRGGDNVVILWPGCVWVSQVNCSLLRHAQPREHHMQHAAFNKAQESTKSVSVIRTSIKTTTLIQLSETQQSLNASYPPMTLR